MLKNFFLCGLINFSFIFPLIAEELIINTTPENPITLEITPQDSFIEVMRIIKADLEIVESDDSWLDLSKSELQGVHLDFSPGKIVASKPKKQDKPARNYFAPLTPAEKNDIGYILRTLANNPILKIAAHKSSLKKAGDRVDHVHPLRFLQCIFGDEELKVCAHNIQGKSWVWDEFLDGIVTSFNEEIAKFNVPPEFIIDFANILGINVHLIYPSYLEHKWVDIVNILIAFVPRQEGDKKYDW